MFASQVINYANNQARATSLLDELHGIPRIRSAAQSPRFDAIQADVGDRSAIQRLVQETVAKFGRLDVVVSNAGWTRKHSEVSGAYLRLKWTNALLQV